jgi:DNA mismatch repair ATPase MutS
MLPWVVQMWKAVHSAWFWALGGLTIGFHVFQEERVLRNNKNYETLDTNKSGVRFRSPALTDLNSEYIQAHDSYTEKQKAIVNEIINIAG